MKVAFLGSFGFHNLGDELCLYESVRRFGSHFNFVFSNDSLWTKSVLPTTGEWRFFRTREELLKVQPDRIVLGGGGVGFLPSLKDAIHWMSDHTDRECELIINNIGVAVIGPDWIDSNVLNVFFRLKSFSVRDQTSLSIVQAWDVKLNVQLTRYPEIDISPVSSLVNDRVTGLIGISITGQKAMSESICERAEFLIQLIEHHDAKLGIVPIISAWQQENEEENDFHGFQNFINVLGLGKRVLNLFLDFEEWRGLYTVGQLRRDIQGLRVLITQRKHNAIHAIGTGVPFISICPREDDSLQRLWNEVGHRATACSKHCPL
jgi:hypothetical protein